MQEQAPDVDPGLARVVLITAPDLSSARSLGRALVEARVAACANLVPGVTSIFRWEGALQEAAEVLLVVKTRADRLEDLGRLVAELHPYEVPELVALRPDAVAPSYLAWLLSESAP
jgi:periplasmic divalent cation tolerance protein